MMNGIRISLISTLLVGCATAPVTDPQPVQACSPPLDGSSFTCPDYPLPLRDPPVLMDPPVLEEDRHVYPTPTSTVFDTRASAPPPNMWVNTLRDWKSRQNRTPVDEMLNKSLAEYKHGSDDPAKQEKLLQLPSSIN